VDSAVWWLLIGVAVQETRLRIVIIKNCFIVVALLYA
jgi:hypothetical protein